MGHMKDKDGSERSGFNNKKESMGGGVNERVVSNR